MHTAVKPEAVFIASLNGSLEDEKRYPAKCTVAGNAVSAAVGDVCIGRKIILCDEGYHIGWQGDARNYEVDPDAWVRLYEEDWRHLFDEYNITHSFFIMGWDAAKEQYHWIRDNSPATAISPFPRTGGFAAEIAAMTGNGIQPSFHEYGYYGSVLDLFGITSNAPRFKEPPSC